MADSTCAEACWMLTSDFFGPVHESFFFGMDPAWNLGFFKDALSLFGWTVVVHISEITWSCQCLKRQVFTGV